MIPSYTVRKEDGKKASGKCSFIYCRGIGPLSGYEIKTFSHKGVGETIFSPLMRKIPHILSAERPKVKVPDEIPHKKGVGDGICQGSVKKFFIYCPLRGQFEGTQETISH